MDISSKIISFLNKEHNYLVHMFIPEKLFEFLSIINGYSDEANVASESFLLNFIPLTVLLKPGEHIGVYIDSSDPSFLFKLEANFSGYFRSMLLPESFADQAPKITGKCRINKYFPGGQNPYSSQIELSNHDIQDICTKVLSHSYQMDARMLIDENKKYSTLICKLPKLKNDTIEAAPNIDFNDFIQKWNSSAKFIFEKSQISQEISTKELENMGFTLLVERKINFRCNCSREQFLPSLKQIYIQEGDSLFKEDSITINCDYCKSIYTFNKSDLINFQIN